MNEALTTPERLYFRTHGLVLLKPDTVKLILENYFISDLEELGLNVIFRQYLNLKTSDISSVYPEWVNNHKKFEAITDNMTKDPSLLLLLKSNTEFDDIHNYIKKIKGRADTPGLRNKYIYLFENDLQKIYQDEDQFLRELNKNRIHSPENGLEALKTIIFLWPRLNKEELCRVQPNLCDIISNRLALSLYVT